MTRRGFLSAILFVGLASEAGARRRSRRWRWRRKRRMVPKPVKLPEPTPVTDNQPHMVRSLNMPSGEYPATFDERWWHGGEM